IGFRDDFATDTLRTYTIEGEVRWQKGRVALGKKARLSRTVPMSWTAEVEASVQVGTTLTFLLTDTKRSARVVLTRQDGQLRLRQNGVPPDVLLEPTGGGWKVRLRIRYGLVELKAWPGGAREPDGWQGVQYAGAAAWQPTSVTVEGPGVLTHLAVSGP